MVPRPPARDERSYTIVSHFASHADAGVWLASEVQARLVAEAVLHAAEEPHTPYLSGLKAWLAAPSAPVLLPPAVKDRAGLGGRDLAAAGGGQLPARAPACRDCGVGRPRVRGDHHSAHAVRGDAAPDTGRPAITVPGAGRPAAERCVMSSSATSPEGKAALVTGAATGIGKTIAAALATAGAQVVVNHNHTPEPAEKMVADIQAAGRTAIAIAADALIMLGRQPAHAGKDLSK